MYNVLYLNGSDRPRTIAEGLGRQKAIETARFEAKRRGVGRMFLAGSEPVGDVIVIVPAQRAA